MRIFRDGYNRTNLTFGSFRTFAEVALSAQNEPWDGPGVMIMIRVGRRWMRLDATFGRRR
jgi:hypothetical protein